MPRITAASFFAALRMAALSIALAISPMANAVDCPPFTSVENCVNLAIAEDKEKESRYALIGLIGGIALLGVFIAVSASASDTESEGDEPDPAERSTIEEPDPADKATLAPLPFGRGIRGFAFAAPQNSGVNLHLGYRAGSDGDSASGTLNTAIEWRF